MMPPFWRSQHAPHTRPDLGLLFALGVFGATTGYSRNRDTPVCPCQIPDGPPNDHPYLVGYLGVYKNLDWVAVARTLDFTKMTHLRRGSRRDFETERSLAKMAVTPSFRVIAVLSDNTRPEGRLAKFKAIDLSDRATFRHHIARLAADLLLVDHPGRSSRIWTNPHYKARNLYFQFGHKPDLFKNGSFTTLFLNAIRWGVGAVEHGSQEARMSAAPAIRDCSSTIVLSTADGSPPTNSSHR
jgi:hypothetical protein